LSATNAGSNATISAASPTLEASAQTACPTETPTAVRMPPRRPPSSEFRIVRAVSCPGLTMTRSEIPTKAANISA
jgi:hypothetical protein